jgi:hypothetical protein
MYLFSRFARSHAGVVTCCIIVVATECRVSQLQSSCGKKVVVTRSSSEPESGSRDTQVNAGEEAVKPQRGSRWVDLLILAVIIVVLLGGIGKAFSDSDIFAEPQNDIAVTGEACPQAGCVKPPDELCAGRPIKAIVGADGSKLYYTGDHPNYQGIIAIHVERGDRWFCTEAGAKAGGFGVAP